VIVGVSSESREGRRIERRAARSGVRNILLRPRVPLSDVAGYLYAADCLLIPPTDAPLNRYRRTVLPMKVFPYLAAGRAIIAPRLPDIEEVLTDGANGCLVPANDIARAADALRALLRDPAERKRLGSAAVESSRAYTWEARARRVVRFLQGIRN
jgi:glycosyltransferase involved in cell wall biosynthesis